MVMTISVLLILSFLIGFWLAYTYGGDLVLILANRRMASSATVYDPEITQDGDDKSKDNGD